MITRHVLAGLATLVVIGAPSAKEATPHWGYHGATDPVHWAALEPEFRACGIGKQQSPIDIKNGVAQKSNLPPIEFDYKPVPLRMIDNGHTVQVNYPPGSFISVGGHRYQLIQFHFHKPSEESIDGKRFDMVAHLVHRDADGRLAVVAVLLTPGAINPMVAALWSNWPTRKEAEVSVNDLAVDASDLLPANRAYFTFAGSLTTPPCSEGVTWFVLRTPSTLSSGEISRFGHAYPMNARPLQPLNGRVVRASN